jgi:hypothetical protein
MQGFEDDPEAVLIRLVLYVTAVAIALLCVVMVLMFLLINS